MIELDSVEKLTEFLNRPKNKDWTKYCESDLKLYHRFQFETPLNLVRANMMILEEFESIIKSKEVNKKEAHDLIRFNIFFGLNNLNQCKEALEFLKERKYFKEDKIKSFQKEFLKIENILYNYIKKFANVMA